MERTGNGKVRSDVARYFFDTFDDDTFIKDDVGQECADVTVVKELAAASLVELARDVLPGSVRRHLAVKVHDGSDPVLDANLTFEAIIVKQ